MRLSDDSRIFDSQGITPAVVKKGWGGYMRSTSAGFAVADRWAARQVCCLRGYVVHGPGGAAHLPPRTAAAGVAAAKAGEEEAADGACEGGRLAAALMRDGLFSRATAHSRPSMASGPQQHCCHSAWPGILDSGLTADERPLNGD